MKEVNKIIETTEEAWPAQGKPSIVHSLYADPDYTDDHRDHHRLYRKIQTLTYDVARLAAMIDELKK